VSLVGQWREIVRGLPERWADARLRLTLADGKECDRAAALLAPLNPGRRDSVLRFHSARGGAGSSPGLVERLLQRLDDERIVGKLELVGSGEAVPKQVPDRPTLAGSWEAQTAALPPDWSDLYAEVELVSTDWLDRAALLLAPVNPARHGDRPAFRFRVARRFGYGASAEMTRRCLERLDDSGIHGQLRVLHALSDTKPVYTQGPVWYVGCRAV
jgi:hypothetical protein